MKELELLEQKTETLLRAYYCERDWEKVLRFFDPESATLVAVGGVRAASYEELAAMAREEKTVPENSALSGLCLHGTAVSRDVCLVAGGFAANISIEEGSPCHRRVTCVFLRRGEAWKVVHLHLSAPGAQMDGENSDAAGSLDYEALRRALEERNAQIEMIAKTTTGGMKGSFDDDFYTFYYVSDGLCSMLGYTREEFMEMSGGTAVGAAYPPDLPAALAACEACFQKGPEYRTEYRIRKKDGSLIWVQDSGRRVKNADGTTTINSMIIDISELKEAMNQLKIEQERYETVAELSADIIFEYDVKTDVLEQFFPASADRPKRKVITQAMQKNQVMRAPKIHADDVERLVQVLCGSSEEAGPGGFDTAEFRQLTVEGDYRWYRALSKKIRDSEGVPVKTIGKVEDIHAARRLLMESRTDMLTGAYNRSYLEVCVEEYLRGKSEDVFGACLLIDIDHFKQINDTYGHLLGDRVLVGLVKRLKSLYRATDLKARMGGDEFVVFMKDLYSMDLIEEKLKKLQGLVLGLGREEGIAEEVTLSIGIAVTGPEHTACKSLYRDADIALYHAKTEGRNRYRFYTPGMQYPAEAAEYGQGNGI